MTVHTTMTSPVGELTIVATDDGLRAILWPLDGAERVHVGESREDPDHAVLRATVDQLVEYFAGERLQFDLPLDPVGSDFQQEAWAALREIPYGETVSYGEQAARLGDRNKARAVGAANGKNPISIVVPCHRVIGASGSLTGFAGGLDAKIWLLDHERRHAGHTLPL